MVASGLVFAWLTMVERGKFTPIVLAWGIWALRGPSTFRIQPQTAYVLLNAIILVTVLAGVDSYKKWCRGPLTGIAYGTSLLVQLVRAMDSLIALCGDPSARSQLRRSPWPVLTTSAIMWHTSSWNVVWWTFWLAALASGFPWHRARPLPLLLFVSLLVCPLVFRVLAPLDERFTLFWNLPEDVIVDVVVLAVIIPCIYQQTSVGWTFEACCYATSPTLFVALRVIDRFTENAQITIFPPSCAS